jgi:hypothetical protein
MERSATSGSWSNYNIHLTTMAKAGSLPPFPHSATACHLELNFECVDNSGWAWVAYEVRGGEEKLFSTYRPPPAVAAPLPSRQPGRHPVIVRRRVSDRRRKEAWA